MGNRISKVVTKTGDQGSTGLADGSRRAKNDIRIHCIGEIDELNAVIGLMASFMDSEDTQDLVQHIQHDLFDLGAELSQPGKQLLNEDYVEFLDMQIELLNVDLPALKEFILPGGSPLLGSIHLARTVSRRVERTFIDLQQHESVNPASQRYLNRLSDLFFILARFMAQQTGHAESYWQSEYSRIKPS